jgi:transcriptional regulator with PAS, ATPase and Fis domain
MAENKMLVCWIGGADLRAMASALNDENLLTRVNEALNAPKNSVMEGEGPIKTLVSQREFDEIHLLTNWPDDWNERFRSWIGCSPQIHPIDHAHLSDPTDYRNVYDTAKDVLDRICKKHWHLSMHLSPGTPTMAAVWLLLGKTLFPATLYQSHKGEVREAVIPFDIMTDVVPELLHNSDRQFQQLAFSSPGDVIGFEEIKGNSTALKYAVDRARRVAIRDVPTLLTGESGTGKEMFARAMHLASKRGRNDARLERFVAINCAAIPSSLFEGELFGVGKGAFTDAKESRKGAFERADGGTLFLDEVGELAPENQAKLLRALQPPPSGGLCQCVIRRVGGTKDISCDVRIIAATNRNLVEAINSRQFRDDLFYRLATIQIRLPPLRDRRKDIEILATTTLSRLNDDFKRSEPGYAAKKLHHKALKRLLRYDWPGNVRELNNVLTQAAIFAPADEISVVDIDSAIASFDRTSRDDVFSRSRGSDFHLKTRLAQIEQFFIQEALKETDNIQSKAAKLLGISQQSLHQKLTKSIGTDSSAED